MGMAVIPEMERQRQDCCGLLGASLTHVASSRFSERALKKKINKKILIIELKGENSQVNIKYYSKLSFTKLYKKINKSYLEYIL